jgi:hypothetical protein
MGTELAAHLEWLPDCTTPCVCTSLVPDPDGELLRRVVEISGLCEEMERAVQSLIDYHAERSESVENLRVLEATVAGLKRQLLQHYLECRIGEAALEARVQD